MKTIAVIPTINTIGLVAPLAEQLLTGDVVDEVWLFDAGTDSTMKWAYHRAKLDDRLRWFDTRGERIYDLWNRAVLSNSYEPTNVAILNSDIRLPPNAIAVMSSLMRGGGFTIATVDPTRPALHSQHHLAWNPSLGQLTSPVTPRALSNPARFVVGWAFVVAAEFWNGQEYAVHPGFEWWYGDDDLFLRTEQLGGKICRIEGIGSDHIGSVSDPYNPDKVNKTQRDAELFRKLWGAR